MIGTANIGVINTQRLDVDWLSARNYVQDGLVAMWDGIENAGYGVHSDNPLDFVELVSGQQALLISPYTSDETLNAAPLTMNSKGIRSNSIESAGVGVGIPYTASISPFTVEWTYTLHDREVGVWNKYRWTRIINYLPLATGSPAHSIILANYNLRNKMYYSGEWQPADSSIGLNSTSYGRHVGTQEDGTGTGSYNACRYVINGNIKMARYNASLYCPSGTTHRVLAIGDCVDSTLHNYRIYNRWLSDDEVLYNQEIDKARFNLP